MNKLMEDVKLYLQKVLHLSFKIYPLKKQESFPFFLTDLYDFREITLCNRKSLLMIAKTDEKITPAEIGKHIKQIEKKWSGLCIYVHRNITSYDRDRLIKGRIAFVVPGNQMYLPDLGIDLREHFIKLKKQSKKFLSPATQTVLIYALLGDPSKKFFSIDLAQRLKYTVMTINRAFDELKAASIGDVLWQGKERYWNFSGSKNELWEQAKSLMRSPLKNRFWTSKIPSIKNNKPLAGLSALSHYSTINPPSLPIFAISSKDQKFMQKTIVLSSEDAAAELQIWRYDPNLFQQEGIVDPFSLYLSFEDNKDERIESALQEIVVKNT